MKIEFRLGMSISNGPGSRFYLFFFIFQIGSRSINFNDLEAAIGSTSKTVSSEELAKFAEFANQHKA